MIKLSNNDINMQNLAIINGHYSHLPRLNYGCKIECLQVYLFDLFHGYLVMIIFCVIWFMLV